jgi:hypothetical protein
MPARCYQAVHRHRLENGGRPSYRIVLGDLPPAQAPRRTPKGIVLVAATGVGVLVLLMACGNVGNLLILSGLRRGAELSMKAALGATRWRLARELVLQALLLAMLAGCGSARRRTDRWRPRPRTVPPGDRGDRGGGRCPAGRGSPSRPVPRRPSSSVWPPAISLTSARTLAPGRTLRRRESTVVLGGFVVLQVALSVPLVVGTLLFVASMRHATHLDLGVEPSRVLVVRTNLADDGRPDEQHGFIGASRTGPARRNARRRCRVAGPGAPLEGLRDLLLGTTTIRPAAAVCPGSTPSTRPSRGPRAAARHGPHLLRRRQSTDGRQASRSSTKPWPPSSGRGRPSLGRCLHVQGERDCTRVVGVVARLPFFASLAAANGWRLRATGAAATGALPAR